MKDKKIIFGGFLKGFLRSSLLSIIIMFSSFIIMPLIVGVIGADKIIYSPNFITLIVLTLLFVCVIPIILGITNWSKYKDENAKLALGYLIGSFMPLIIIATFILWVMLYYFELLS